MKEIEKIIAQVEQTYPADWHYCPNHDVVFRVDVEPGEDYAISWHGGMYSLTATGFFWAGGLAGLIKKLRTLKMWNTM